MFDEPDSGLDPVRTAFLNELILDLNRKLGPTMIVVTHDIATARRIADHIGMLYRSKLVKFGTNKEMFECDLPAVRQFLAGETKGPIGMSEEADAGRTGAVSTWGLNAEETEELERTATDRSPGQGKRERQRGRVPAATATRGHEATEPIEWDALAPKERSAIEMLLEGDPPGNGR